MEIWIIVNSHAGRQNILKEIDSVQTMWEEAGHCVTTVLTATTEQAERIVCRAAERKAGMLVCCGGDGTLNETVTQVLKIGTKIPLGYIPAGTTNDFAMSLGLSRDPVKAAKDMTETEPKALDIGRFGDRKFLYVASFGAFTQSSYATEQSMKNTWGHLAYVIEGLKELPELRPYKLRVETAEGETFSGEYIFGAMCNTLSFGGVVKLDPAKVDLSDGKFELLLVKNPQNLDEWSRVIVSLVSEKYDEELITFTHTSKASFFCEEPMPWSLDGEYAPGGEQVEAEVLPKAIELIY